MKRYTIHDSKQNKFCTYKNDENNDVVLHEDIINILFSHKQEVHKKLIDLRGAFLIDHIAITIIDPGGKVIIFSITPSVEYNLIAHNPWKHDFGFSIKFQKNNSFYIWEKAYSKKFFNEIKQMKETNHGFTFGFNISKKIDSYNLIYSYATRNENSDLNDYYHSHVNELSRLGDYAYTLIHNIYKKYNDSDAPLPTIDCNRNYFAKPFLRLIVNNKREGQEI